MPAYSAAPEVPSEKKIFPSLDVPDLIVIPQAPLSAIVKLSAVESPSVVVAINTRPLESMRANSPVLLSNLKSFRALITELPVVSFN